MSCPTGRCSTGWLTSSANRNGPSCPCRSCLPGSHPCGSASSHPSTPRSRARWSRASRARRSSPTIPGWRCSTSGPRPSWKRFERRGSRKLRRPRAVLGNPRPRSGGLLSAAGALHAAHTIAAVDDCAVTAASAGDPVAATAVTHLDPVVPAAARDLVAGAVADQVVVPGAAVQAVLAAAAVDAISGAVAGQPVGAGVAADPVPAAAAGHAVLAGAAEDDVVTACGVDAVVASQAADDVLLGRPDEDVVPRR